MCGHQRIECVGRDAAQSQKINGLCAIRWAVYWICRRRRASVLESAIQSILRQDTIAITRRCSILDKSLEREEKECFVPSVEDLRTVIAHVWEKHWSADVASPVMLMQKRCWNAVEIVEKCVGIVPVIDQLEEAATMERVRTAPGHHVDLSDATSLFRTRGSCCDTEFCGGV